MQITEITVSWTETANLGNYSNVKPSLSLKGTIAPGEDEVAETDRMMALCKAYVQEQVDQALEAEGRAAKYSTDPRFDILYSGYRTKIVVIVPTGMRVEGASCAIQKHRYDTALKWAAERYDDGQQLFTCADGTTDAATAAIAAAEAEYERRAAEQRVENERLRAERDAEYTRQPPEREHAEANADLGPYGDDESDDDEDDDE